MEHVDGSYEWLVTFYSPVGNVPSLRANASGLIADDARVDIATLRKGKALRGRFNLVWDETDSDGSTRDLSHDASETEIAAALAPWVGQVSVTKRERSHSGTRPPRTTAPRA